MTQDQMIELAETFRLLGDANRLSIVLSCLHEPVGVGVLAEELGLSQSLVSHHLRLLRAARLVRASATENLCVTSPPMIMCAK